MVHENATKMGAMRMFKFNRRQFLMTSAATVVAASITAPAFAADPILIGCPPPSLARSAWLISRTG